MIQSHTFSLSRFVRFYWLYAIPIVALTVLVVAWVLSFRASQAGNVALELNELLVVFAIPAVLSTVLSFLAQYYYARRRVSQDVAAGTFSISRFTRTFYGLNLLVSIVLSILAIPMFINLFFFLAGLIPIFYLTPSYLILGYLLARRIERGDI